jgi:4-amino-4-deoxy-L-arabinose transferase-like glycosyltransferase
MALVNQLLKFLDDKYNQLFLVILFSGIFLRLKYFSIESIWNDASVHLWHSIKLLHEPVFIFTTEFLTGDYVIPQFITSFFYIFTNDIFIAGKLMALVYFFLGIIFIYLLGSALKNKTIGIMASILFLFNPLIWFYGVRPLVDAPLTTMFVIVAYCVIKLEKEKTMFWSYVTILTIFVAMLTKMPAILLLVSFVTYILLFKRKEIISSKAIKNSVIYLVGVLFSVNILFYFIFNHILITPFFVRVFRLVGIQQGFEVTSYLPHMVSWYVLVLFLLGLFFIFFYKYEMYYFIIISLFIYYTYFEFAVISFDRYILPIVPYIILIAVYGLDEFAKILNVFFKIKYIRLIFTVSILFLVCTIYFSYGTTLIDSKINTYTGYQEAGSWIKDNVSDTNVVIFAGSWRSIRAFSEREVYNSYSEYFDGSIVNLRSDYYQQQSNFEQDLQKAINDGKQIYLEIDIWEYAQHNWYFPLTQESVGYFQQLGFIPIVIIEKEVQIQEGLHKIPVILIFKYGS